MTKILMVFTAAAVTPTGKPAGYYLPEAAHPYYSFDHAGFDVDFASPEGRKPPVNEWSRDKFRDTESVDFLQDTKVIEKLSNCKTLDDVNVADYDAVFYPGGHGPVIDLSKDPKNTKLASDFWKQNKLVTAVCHGPAALVLARDAEGKSIFEGRKFTGFSNEEEKADGLPVDDIGFWLEDEITKLGGKFECSEKMQPHVTVDGRLYTGQNPSSAKLLGDRIVEGLPKRQK